MRYDRPTIIKFNRQGTLNMYYKKLLLTISIYAISTLSAQTILVTGGAGFIGASVTETLLTRGDTIVIIDAFKTVGNATGDAYNAMKYERLSTLQSRYPENLFLYAYDIEDKNSIEHVFQNHPIDTVCHLAAHAGVRASINHPDEFIQTNIAGSVNIFECGIKHNVKNYVVASSSSVYGDNNTIPFSEENRTDMQASLYGMTKKSLELMAAVYNRIYGVSVTCLRFFTVYGPYGRFDMAPFIFMNAIANEKTITVYGDGSAIRDFTYVDDIVNGIISSIDKPNGLQVINLGSGNTVTVNEFIQIIADTVGKQPLVEYKQFLKADVYATQADLQKASLLLEYKPKVMLKEGIRKMYEWYKNVYQTCKQR